MNEVERERLAKLEVRVEHAEQQLTQVINDIGRMSSSIAGINKTLNKVYYIVVGSIIVVLIEAFGIDEVLKKIFL